MSSQTDLEQERRKQILDAAEKVFTQRGFNKARMDDIVAESGLSKGALYWYYKSKDEIILALMDRFFAGEYARLHFILRPHRNRYLDQLRINKIGCSESAPLDQPVEIRLELR